MPTNARGYEVPTLATDAVLVEEGKVLLIQRGNEPFQGAWALPGGFVETGETVESACVRELAEETGIEAEVRELVGVYSDPERDPRGHVVSIPFIVRRALGEDGVEAEAADDADAVDWFRVGELPELAFDHRAILQDAIRERARRGPGPG